MMSPSAVESGPEVLLLGKIDHARKEWEALGESAVLRERTEGTRAEFITDCQAGVYDNVVAFYRTFDSVKVTGRFDAELVPQLPRNLRFIAHNGAGYDQIDADVCAAHGILVSNTPKAVDGATADVAMFLLLGALRRAWQSLSSLRDGRWRGSSGLGHDPQDRTLGVLGMGGIGTALAVRAAAFGMKIQYHNRHPVPEDRDPTRATYVSFDELLRSSDVISVHLPLTPSTWHTLDREQFQKMKEGAVLINTARGPVINEAALVDALESGKLFSAGLDVYEEEPQIHPKLVKNDKVMLLPHIGTATSETQKAMEVLVIDNIKSAIEHGSMLTPVNATSLKR